VGGWDGKSPFFVRSSKRPAHPANSPSIRTAKKVVDTLKTDGLQKPRGRATLIP
jgi:hypothetical protein